MGSREAVAFPGGNPFPNADCLIPTAAPQKKSPETGALSHLKPHPCGCRRRLASRTIWGPCGR